MKIGLMSFAHLHAEAYIHNLRELSDVEVIGFTDEDRHRGEYFERIFNTRYFPSNEGLLAEKPDGVIVCSENANHKRHVEMAAQAGIHVMSEKPIATTLIDAKQMIDSCKHAGVSLMTAFPMRFSQPMLEMKEMLDDNGLGTLYAMNTTNQGQLPKRQREWFVDKILAGGGAVMDHTVHLVDLMRWFLGCEVLEVFAQTNHIMHEKTVEVETGGLVMLTFENGVFASIDCSWSRPDYFPTWGGLTMELIGERGVVTVDGFKQNIQHYGNKEQHTIWIPWGSDANQGMINEFITSIKDGRSPSITGMDGYKSLEIAIAVYESAKCGLPVKLPLSVI